MAPQPYNPDWLVALATAQHADKPWLAEAFARCTTVVKGTEFIIHFVDPTDANKPGAEYQFDACVWLVDPAEGNLLVDVLKDRRVGSVEFYDRLFGRGED